MPAKRSAWRSVSLEEVANAFDIRDPSRVLLLQTIALLLQGRLLRLLLPQVAGSSLSYRAGTGAVGLRRRQADGASATSFLNARLNAASDS